MKRDESARVTVEFDVPAQMRDGVTLRADVYRPDGSGPWPTLLTRTPCGKRLVREREWCGLDPVSAARQGFIVVVQDARGRWASDGDWVPLRFEQQDGYDTVEWAAKLPGSNGHVGTFGGSYDGHTQVRTAIERPPSLRAISPLMTWSDPMDGVFARGGAVELNLVAVWTLDTGVDYVTRLNVGEAEIRRRLDAVMDERDRLADHGFWDLPVGEEMAVFQRHGLPELGTIGVLRDPGVAEWSRVADKLERIDVPSLHTAGWYDLFLQGTLDNYAGIVAHGGDARLLVGPWTHLAFADPIGEQFYGMRASRDLPMHAGCDWSQLQLDWLRGHLTPGAAEIDLPEAPVRIFVMGRNEWRDEVCWPPERADVEQWFLGAGATLSPGAGNAHGAATQFTYDPDDPVPTLGGHTMTLTCPFDGGPVDQRPIEARDDVCVFTSDPLVEEIEVTGRVRAVLHVESSASSTDWVVRLCDVHPDERSFNICDGIIRIREGADACHRVQVDLWSTCNVFLSGHRLRVHVTSSSFPRWDRNLNTGDQRAADHQPAFQRIYHDSERRSWIELPVIRRYGSGLYGSQ